MKTICGIYRITNLKNRKQYIGQSRNVFARWRQHTSNLSPDKATSLIRKAFVKYGLREIVRSPGIHSGFLFEIIEECSEEKLFQVEYKWIEREKPAYNVHRMPPNPDFEFQNRPLTSERFWIQYHNANKEMCYPGHLFGGEDVPILEHRHFISTKKREVIKCLGDSILMVVGIEIGRKPKNYFAWSLIKAEELEYFDDLDLSFNVCGEQKYFQEPILLNTLPGFKEFQSRQGNFAFGFQNIVADPFFCIFQKIISGPFVEDEKLSWRDWVLSFEEKYNLDLVRSVG